MRLVHPAARSVWNPINTVAGMGECLAGRLFLDDLLKTSVIGIETFFVGTKTSVTSKLYMRPSCI